MEFQEHYYPLVTDDLLHLIGNTGLLGPEDVSEDEERGITLYWEGFRKAGWRTTCSARGCPSSW